MHKREMHIKVTITIGGHAGHVIAQTHLHGDLGQAMAHDTAQYISQVTQHAMAGNHATQRRLPEYAAHEKHFMLRAIAAIRMHYITTTALIALHRPRENAQ